MNYRIADSTTNSQLATRINTQRSLIGKLEERLASGKRINRVSDDPAGAQAVIVMRTSQTEIEQFKRSAAAVNQRLIYADDTLNNYGGMLDRARTLLSQGMSDTTSAEGRSVIATELETIRVRILSLANSKNDEEYVFGGTRQNAPPYDPATGVPSAVPAVEQYCQIEPGASTIETGVVAEKIFQDGISDIFTDLTNAVAALRGTGVPATDKATLELSMGRLDLYGDSLEIAQARIGANMNTAETAIDNLTMSSLSLDERANEIEGDNFADTAVDLTEAKSALEAILQVTARGRRSVFDFLG